MNENVTKERKKGLKELKKIHPFRNFKAKRQFQYQFIDFRSLFFIVIALCIHKESNDFLCSYKLYLISL